MAGPSRTRTLDPLIKSLATWTRHSAGLGATPRICWRLPVASGACDATGGAGTHPPRRNRTQGARALAPEVGRFGVPLRLLLGDLGPGDRDLHSVRVNNDDPAEEITVPQQPEDLR